MLIAEVLDVDKEQSPSHALEVRVRHLEDRLRALRAGRRVLMDLLLIREEDRKMQLARLEAENRRLRERNRRYAHFLMCERARAAKARQPES